MMSRQPVGFAILCVLAVAALGILLRPLTPIDETRYLAVAWEMHLSGNWLVPTKNFAIYSDKPPLLFWLVNLVWLVTGVSEVAGRMVVPLAAALSIWLAAVLARSLWPQDRGVGGRAALALAGLAMFDLSAGLTMFDILLTVATLLGLIALVAAAEQAKAGRPGWWAWGSFGAAIALGVLAKGPVILFHLLPAAISLPWWSGNALPWRALPARLGLGLLAGLALVLLWLVPAALTGGPEYRDAILWHQSVDRMANGADHGRPWWFFAALLPVLVFPLGWSRGIWQAAWRAPWRGDAELRLCLVWAGTAFVLFTLTSGKQLHYLVPELAAVALIAARLTGASARFDVWPAAIAVLVIVIGVTVAALLSLVPLADGGIAAPALLTWAFLMLALCWLAVQQRGFAGMLLLALGGLTAANLLIWQTDLGRIFSTHPIAGLIAPHQAQGLAYTGASYHAEFNFAGRLTEPVATPENADQLQRWMAARPEGLIVGRRAGFQPGWAPYQTINFGNYEYGLWRVAEAPVNDRVSK